MWQRKCGKEVEEEEEGEEKEEVQEKEQEIRLNRA